MRVFKPKKFIITPQFHIMHCGRIKDGDLSQGAFLVISLLAIGVLGLLWIVGNYENMNNWAMLVYILFFLFLFLKDSLFIAEYVWAIFMMSLNVLGVYVCEQNKLQLVEQNTYSGYANALIPLLVVYIVFFSVIAFCGLRSRKKDAYMKVTLAGQFCEQMRFARIITLVGIAICIVLFLPIIKTPYFVLGLSRIKYSQTFLAGWQNSLKSYLILFLPVAVNVVKSDKKMPGIIFFMLLLGYYFWTGDKFGAYFLVGYIILLSILPLFCGKQLKIAIISMGMLFACLLAVVFVQRVLLYNDGWEQFINYLFTRLSNQGGVWWKMYNKFADAVPRIAEFKDEILGILPGSNMPNYEYGQWKMMLVSGDYSDYAWYRVKAGDPYTSTTGGSLIYYFGYFGVVVFYGIAGFVYYKLIAYSKYAFFSNKVIESMLLVKVMIMFHALISASDMYIFSYKGCIYLFAILILAYLRNQKMRIVFQKNKIA